MVDVYQIRAPHFVAGMDVEDGVVTVAAPILRWTVGKRIDWIKDYCRRKLWLIALIKANADA